MGWGGHEQELERHRAGEFGDGTEVLGENTLGRLTKQGGKQELLGGEKRMWEESKSVMVVL